MVRLPARTTSAAARNVALPHSTATPTSARRRSSWSFSASPIATVLRADSRRVSSAACRPVALLIPCGIVITRPALKMSTSGS